MMDNDNGNDHPTPLTFASHRFWVGMGWALLSTAIAFLIVWLIWG